MVGLNEFMYTRPLRDTQPLGSAFSCSCHGGRVSLCTCDSVPGRDFLASPGIMAPLTGILASTSIPESLGNAVFVFCMIRPQSRSASFPLSPWIYSSFQASAFWKRQRRQTWMPCAGEALWLGREALHPSHWPFLASVITIRHSISVHAVSCGCVLGPTVVLVNPKELLK